MVTSINIKTDLWNKAIQLLTNGNWTITYQYDGFDAGIDSNLIILEKNNEVVLFGWDNWLEGEIQCNENRMNEIETLIGEKLERGEPTNLKPTVIQTYLTDEAWTRLKELLK